MNIQDKSLWTLYQYLIDLDINESTANDELASLITRLIGHQQFCRRQGFAPGDPTPTDVESSLLLSIVEETSRLLNLPQLLPQRPAPPVRGRRGARRHRPNPHVPASSQAYSLALESDDPHPLLRSSRTRAAVSASAPAILASSPVLLPSALPPPPIAHSGFSRNPLLPIALSHRQSVALAVLLYLLRGHAAFYCRPKSHRDYNAALTSLNDFHQAAQLISRLHISLAPNRQERFGKSKEEDLKRILASPLGGAAPEASAHFIWGCRFIADYQRALILREIDHLEDANRHFRECRRTVLALYNHWLSPAPPRPTAPSGSVPLSGAAIRAPQLRSAQSSVTPPHHAQLSPPSRFEAQWIVSPTALRGFFEASKTLFDTGRFLESLRLQTLCLRFACLYYGRPVLERVHDGTPIASRLEAIGDYLETESNQPIFDRIRITSLFGNRPGRLPASWMAAIRDFHFDPLVLVDVLSPRIAPLVASVLAAMGFTLFTFSRSHKRALTAAQRAWLDHYCIFFHFWNPSHPFQHEKLLPTKLGLYCRTLYAGRDSITFELPSGEDIERAFSLEIRLSQKFPIPPKETLNDIEFCRAVLQSTTQNISNMVTIPRRNSRLLMRRGYKHRRIWGDLALPSVPDGLKHSIGRSDTTSTPEEIADREQTLNKFVVLRRWQSYNPRIPRPEGLSIRGGGYFLLWRGKGIVIDPGFDFIQSFYEEGFSLEDIDAVVITHSHPDHDAEFATLLTLLKEWNEFQEKTGRSSLAKTGNRQWDLFLNESVHKKYASWLQASKVEFGRIIPLPSLRWSKETKSWSDDRLRGENVSLNLCQEYHFVLDVIPAWHDDVIGRTSSVGLKFHLYSANGRKRLGILGYTSDTGAYGHSFNPKKSVDTRSVAGEYRDCDVLIAHLGDVRFRELASMMAAYKKPIHSTVDQHPIIVLLRQWLTGIAKDDSVNTKLLASRLKDFLDFATTLDLIPTAALEIELPLADTVVVKIQDWLGEYIEKNGDMETDLHEIIDGPAYLRKIVGKSEIDNELGKQAKRAWEWAIKNVEALKQRSKPADRIAMRLAIFLAASGILYWQYDNHLGIHGIQKLFRAMVNFHKKGRGKRDRLFIVGELPEELTSYRHVIACWLDRLTGNRPRHTGAPRPVHAFTGDIGLHVGLGNGSECVHPKIRCALCTFNNETICAKDNYHKPSLMKEVSIKRQNSAMIYLCTEKNHFPHPEDAPRYFLLDPERRFH